MRGVISFHPVDPGFFETLVEPLLSGDKVNPEIFLDAARRMRRAARLIFGYKLALARLLEQLEPPPPLDEGTLWDKVRTRLERLDHKVPPLARVAQAKLDVDLHLHGRPFFITEGAQDRVAERVAEYAQTEGEARLTSLVVEQFERLDPALARGVEPELFAGPSSDAAYRNELLAGLKKVHDWGRGVRDGLGGSRGGCRGGVDLADELPWQVIHLHSRAVPFWIARDVDGLGTICEAAGILPPAGLSSAADLFAGACAEYPELYEGLRAELQGPRDLGAYVAPQHVPELVIFLGEHGGRMIQAATRHGQGALCTQVLRKIRECLRFAERYGVGYLEASGIHPLLEEPTEAGVADAVAQVR